MGTKRISLALTVAGYAVAVIVTVFGIATLVVGQGPRWPRCLRRGFAGICARVHARRIVVFRGRPRLARDRDGRAAPEVPDRRSCDRGTGAEHAQKGPSCIGYRRPARDIPATALAGGAPPEPSPRASGGA